MLLLLLWDGVRWVPGVWIFSLVRVFFWGVLVEFPFIRGRGINDPPHFDAPMEFSWLRVRLDRAKEKSPGWKEMICWFFPPAEPILRCFTLQTHLVMFKAMQDWNPKFYTFFFPFPVSVLIFHQCFHTTLPSPQPKPIQESMNPNPAHIRSLWGAPEKKKKIQKSCLPIPAFPLHLLFKYIYYWNKFKSKSSLLSAEHFSSSHTPLGTTTPRTNFLLTLCLPCCRFSPICWNIFQLFIPALGTPGKGVQGWEHLAASLVMVTH